MIAPLAACGSASEEVPYSGRLRLEFPILEAERIAQPVIGVDHDPEVYEGLSRILCLNYMGLGFPRCYDEHDGSDFLLDGGFEAMDSGSATVIAAAAGVVTRVEDGHYDRCHGDVATFDVNCDGHEMIGNSVIIEHASGHQTLYWHFKKNSIVVWQGDRVERGDPLGQIGSSGISSQPHLHFELQDAEGRVIDPYAGELSQSRSYWCEQGDPDGLPGRCGQP